MLIVVVVCRDWKNMFVTDLCLKYYRAPRYCVHCVTIVFVEPSALVAQINDLHFLKRL